jgi:hypothetical protein
LAQVQPETSAAWNALQDAERDLKRAMPTTAVGMVGLLDYLANNIWHDGDIRDMLRGIASSSRAATRKYSEGIADRLLYDLQSKTLGGRRAADMLWRRGDPCTKRNAPDVGS